MQTPSVTFHSVSERRYRSQHVAVKPCESTRSPTFVSAVNSGCAAVVVAAAVAVLYVRARTRACAITHHSRLGEWKNGSEDAAVRCVASSARFYYH